MPHVRASVARSTAHYRSGCNPFNKLDYILDYLRLLPHYEGALFAFGCIYQYMEESHFPIYFFFYFSFSSRSHRLADLSSGIFYPHSIFSFALRRPRRSLDMKFTTYPQFSKELGNVSLVLCIDEAGKRRTNVFAMMTME